MAVSSPVLPVIMASIGGKATGMTACRRAADPAEEECEGDEVERQQETELESHLPAGSTAGPLITPVFHLQMCLPHGGAFRQRLRCLPSRDMDSPEAALLPPYTPRCRAWS